MSSLTLNASSDEEQPGFYCPYCKRSLRVPCQHVRAVEYYENGRIKSVTFFSAAEQWPKAIWVFPSFIVTLPAPDSYITGPTWTVPSTTW